MEPPIEHPEEAAPRITCNTFQIPKETCYLTFKAEGVDHTEEIGETNRGEQVMIDYNKAGEIVGIELLDSKEAPKPCMREEE